VPRLGQARLVSIPGNLPDPETRPPGCRFAPRCSYREDACDEAYPAADSMGGTMFACRRGRTITPEPLGVSEQAMAQAHNTGPVVLQAEAVGVDYARSATSFVRGLFGGRDRLRALSDISFSLRRGQCLGVVGESGSGKSTLGRAVLQMIPYHGRVILDGHDFSVMHGRERRAARRGVQVVFQDPRESLNPRMRIGEIVAEPLKLAGMVGARARRDAAAALLDRVGLNERMMAQFPMAVSGGQAQRIAIARALATKPAIIVLDEPTSSLDVSTQAMLLNLLKDLAESDGLSYILISHDIAAVSYMADTIAVLRGGQLMEMGDAASVLGAPQSSYTQELVAASPHFRAINQAGAVSGAVAVADKTGF
jgi:ABC-type microcin C transport system duplicated ATPase subunit YejF